MSDFKDIIDYFRFGRRSEDARARNKNRMAIEVNGDFKYGVPHEEDIVVIEKSALESAIDIRPLRDVANTFVTTLYILDQPNNETEYYIQKEFSEGGNTVAKYQRVPFSASDSAEPWEDKGDTVFTAVTVTPDFYYSFAKEKVLFVYLDEIELFPDTLAYLPKDLPNEAPYEFDYIDEEGYDNSVTDTFFRTLLSTVFNIFKAKNNRVVQLEKSKDAYVIHLFPSIKYKDREQEVRYNRYEKGVSFESAMAAPIIILKFRYVGAMLEYLNKTIFYSLTEPDDFNSELRKDFIDHYNWIISDLVRSKKGNALLEVLYFLPDLAFQHLDDTNLWDIVDNMLENPITNAGLNKEDIMLTLLEALYKSSKTPTIFLKELLHRKTKDKTSYFYKLFDKMNGDNFVKYNEFVKSIWMQSDFINIDNKVLLEKKGKEADAEILYDGPLFLPYMSDKTLGFYHSNVDISWIENYSQLRTILDTGEYERTGEQNSRRAPDVKEIKYEYLYHPFQPIFIKQVEKQNTELKLDNIIPAFYLKAVEEKKTFANIYTTIEYSADILTTLSGVGNIAKFRHLSKLSKLVKITEGIKDADKIAKVATIIARVKLAAGTVEIASGTVSAIIKLSSTESELALSLQKYLFYLELVTLTGELTVALKGGLKKYATEALAQSDDAIRKAHPEIFRHLEEIVGDGLKVLEKNKNYKKYLDDLKNGTVKRAFKDILNVEEEAVLMFYTTTDGYKNFNKALRGEIPITDFYRAQENLMNQALNKLPNYESNEALFRIENLTENQINSIYKKGEIIIKKHFTSSTYSYESIRDAVFLRPYTVIIRIKGKNGKLIENLSTLKKEKEVLFKSNTEYIVENIGYTIDPIDPNDITNYIKEITLIEK